MRKIVLRLRNGKVVAFQADLTTFEELKEKIIKEGIEIDFSNAAFVERSTKASYGRIPDAILPPGDLIFFVVPVRTKLGVDVDEMSYNELRKYVSLLNKTKNALISLEGSKREIVQRVKDYDNTSNQLTNQSSDLNNLEIIEDHAKAILQLVEGIKSKVNAETPPVYAVSIKELEAEAEVLVSLFD